MQHSSGRLVDRVECAVVRIPHPHQHRHTTLYPRLDGPPAPSRAALVPGAREHRIQLSLSANHWTMWNIASQLAGWTGAVQDHAGVRRIVHSAETL